MVHNPKTEIHLVNKMGDSTSFCGFGVTVEEGFIQKSRTTKLKSSSAHHSRKRADVINEAFSSYNAHRVKLVVLQNCGDSNVANSLKE